MAVLIALPLAVILTRVAIAGRELAWFIVALLLFAPLYVQLAGWDAVGAWLELFGRSAPQAPLTGLASSIWVHGVAAVPWAVVLIAAGLAQVPRQEEELALLEAPLGAVFTKVLLPRVAPWIVTAGCFATVLSWQDMTVTNVYLVPTVTEGIYNQIAINHSLSAAGDAVNAVVYWLPGMVVLVGLFALAAVVSQRLLQSDFPKSSFEPMTWPVGRSRLVFSLFVWITLVLLAGIPLYVFLRQCGLQLRLQGGELTRQWHPLIFLRSLQRALMTMHEDFFWTLVTSATAATLALVVATVVAWWGRAGGWRLFAITLGATFLLAIPGPVVGLAVMNVLNQPAVPGFTWLYDRTIAAPALAQAIHSLPMVLLVVWHGLARFDRNQQEAAELDGCGAWTILTRVVLPQRWRAMIAAWGLALAISIGDVACSLLVIPPGKDTIARRIFGLVHSGVDDQVAAACLLLMIFMAIAVAIVSPKLKS